MDIQQVPEHGPKLSLNGRKSFSRGNQVVNGKQLTIPAVSISTVQGEAILAATKKGTTRASIHCGTVSDHTKYPVRHSLVMNKWEQYSARLTETNYWRYAQSLHLEIFV